MAASIQAARAWLGADWDVYWGQPPRGVYLLKEAYMAEPKDGVEMCRGVDKPVVVYVAASAAGLWIVYGRVKPGVVDCPVATFIKEFGGDVKKAVRTLARFVIEVERLPVFQLNPEVLQFAGMCDEYPAVCGDPFDVVKRVVEEAGRKTRRSHGAETSHRSSGPGLWVVDELARLFRDLASEDPSFVDVLRKVLEDPQRLRVCYA